VMRVPRSARVPASPESVERVEVLESAFD
jgi:hypothetical protein